MNITLRAITKEDLPFLIHLYGTVREAELSHTKFSEQEKADFIRQQFHAQHQTYTLRTPQAQFELILLDGKPIGRIYVHRKPAEIRVMDIALLPEWQCQGFGSNLMKQIQHEGQRSRRPVSLHVERNNPKAFEWYTRLGFETTWSDETHVFMVWPQGTGLPHTV